MSRCHVKFWFDLVYNNSVVNSIAYAQILVLIEVPVSSAEELSISAAKDSATQERLLRNDAMLFGFDSVSADSYTQARALAVALSDATSNVIPVVLLGLKADLGVSSNITSMVCTACVL
jgi:hypothetical protein